MNTTYKYQKDYDKLTQTCPPSDYIPQNIDPAFRWVFDSENDERNFISQYHKKPKRFLNKDDITKCKAMGLSMFNNYKGSIDRFNELKEDIGDNVYSTLGTKIAKGVIKINDGVNSKIERLGHFTHHISNLADYQKKFEIIGNLL